MAKVGFELNRDGVRQLMHSAEMLSICTGYARSIAKNAGEGYEVDPYPHGKTRVNVGVKAASPKAVKDCLRNNTLLKAVHR